ncbi:hypothetical protein ACRN9A_16720 [Shewanella frigidimarina]|uniref:hypothetical protein n=1 Tax=Shewanella frigidimarina TaxID=56812 RepID=UPI003D796F16
MNDTFLKDTTALDEFLLNVKKIAINSGVLISIDNKIDELIAAGFQSTIQNNKPVTQGMVNIRRQQYIDSGVDLYDVLDQKLLERGVLYMHDFKRLIYVNGKAIDQNTGDKESAIIFDYNKKVGIFGKKLHKEHYKKRVAVFEKLKVKNSGGRA